jgi:hypothetical protein
MDAICPALGQTIPPLASRRLTPNLVRCEFYLASNLRVRCIWEIISA